MLKLKRRCQKCKILKTFKSFDKDVYVCKRCILNSYKEINDRVEIKEDLRYIYYFIAFTIGFMIGLWVRSWFI